MLQELENCSHEEQLERSRLFSFEQKSRRGDIIDAYQIVRGRDRECTGITCFIGRVEKPEITLSSQVSDGLQEP